ncbi:MAG: GvpL/GvpF family gas vesicle protein, partial [Planctomycetota bacterium]
MRPLAIIRWRDARDLPASPAIQRFGDLAVVLETRTTRSDDTALTPEDYLDAVDDIASTVTCIPLRRSEQGVTRGDLERLLTAGEQRFTSMLTRLDNRDEWSIRIEPADPIHADTPRTGARQRDPRDDSAGASYLARRRIDRAKHLGLDEASAAAAAHIASKVAAIVADTRITRASDGTASVAALVDRDRSIEMESAVTRAA